MVVVVATGGRWPARPREVPGRYQGGKGGVARRRRRVHAEAEGGAGRHAGGGGGGRERRSPRASRPKAVLRLVGCWRRRRHLHGCTLVGVVLVVTCASREEGCMRRGSRGVKAQGKVTGDVDVDATSCGFPHPGIQLLQECVEPAASYLCSSQPPICGNRLSLEGG